MSTGYTAAITEKNLTFPEFAMSCARAFGALVSMRDDPTDAPIPDSFQPSDWHDKQLVASKAELKRLLTLSSDEANKEAEAEYLVESRRRAEAEAESERNVAAYEAMLAQVQAWEPPTPEHIELKKFMVDQITGSIRFDDMRSYYRDHPVLKLSPSGWLALRIAQVEKNIAYYTKEAEKERERTAGRNAWLAALRDSLKPKERTCPD